MLIPIHIYTYDNHNRHITNRDQPGSKMGGNRRQSELSWTPIRLGYSNYFVSGAPQ